VTIVSIIFVLITNYAANAVMFAKLILQAFNPEIINPDYRLVKFIALVTLTAVCLLHTFSRRLGVFINNSLAIYKMILVVIIILTGAVAMGTGKGKSPAVKDLEYIPPGTHNFDDSFGFPFKPTMSNWGNSVLGVLWAYSGWENANYVLGEIKRPPSKETKIFKVATFGSISLITILYLLTNVVYFGVLSTEELMADNGEMVAAKFLVKVRNKL
jgi:amino acid transporter